MDADRWSRLSAWHNAWLAADPLARGQLRDRLARHHPELLAEADGLVGESEALDGAPVDLAPAPDARGGTWARSGVIVFQPFFRDRGLARVPASGGETATILDVKSDDTTRALFYLSLENELHRVEIGSSDDGGATLGVRVKLPIPGFGERHVGTTFAVSPDGRRIYFAHPGNPARPREIGVVMNWAALLAR